MLYDKARIFVQAGGGGNGCMSFRREAHVPKGGPDGGDGGHGGAVVLLCDDSLRDLQSFKRRAHYKAGRGRHGEGDAAPRRRRRGPRRARPARHAGDRRGAARSCTTSSSPAQRVVVAKGGSGGRGNKKFAGATRQAPRFAERGLAGEESWLDLQLKLLADVGLVGLPNAGKSSLLARMTRAAPKVADYPFTTLEPILGTLDGDDRQLVLADIPGLIEGAADGAGLGHDFLAPRRAHARCSSMCSTSRRWTARDPEENFATIERELAEYDERLATLPRILALSQGRPRLDRGGRGRRPGLAGALRRRAARAARSGKSRSRRRRC